MRKTRRTADFYRIKTAKDALYYSAEIPSYAWAPHNEELKFVPIMGENGDAKIKINEEDQKLAYQKLIEGSLFNDPYLMYIASEDTELATRVGFEIMKRALEVKGEVQITNAAEVKREYRKHEPVAMLHNVFDEATLDRKQDVRDWVTKNHDCFRLVILTGTCPYAWDRIVRLKPHMMFQIEKAVRIVRTTRA